MAMEDMKGGRTNQCTLKKLVRTINLMQQDGNTSVQDARKGAPERAGEEKTRVGER